MFSKNTPLKRKSHSFTDSFCSEDNASAEIGDSENLSHQNSDDQAEEQEHVESDCDEESAKGSFFNPSKKAESDSWLDEPEKPDDKVVLESIQEKSSTSEKPQDESKEEIEDEEGITSSAKRRDVCIKSILRSMRRYYCNKLETMTPYVRKEKKIKHKHQTLIKSIHQTVKDLKLDSFGPNISFYFSLFAYSCDMRKILEKSKSGPYLSDNYDIDIPLIYKAIQLINLIENALNRFSKKIFSKLINIPEISFMVQHYLASNPESFENSKEYEECIKILDEQSKKVGIKLLKLL
jgi:hypothetical protein